jgi:hypothetical protein
MMETLRRLLGLSRFRGGGLCVEPLFRGVVRARQMDRGLTNFLLDQIM